MDLTLLNAIALLGTGLLAGVLGGLVGLGGAIVMIPLLALILRGGVYDNQHLFQAASLAVTFVVAIPAAIRHRRAGAVRWEVVKVMLPAAMVAIAAGVLVSNLFDGRVLQRIFAIFLVYVALMNIRAMVSSKPEPPADRSPVPPTRSAIVGGTMGFAAGLLGVGGGVIAIPLCQFIARLPLRAAIATSSAVMVWTSIPGAALKIGTLHQHGQSPLAGVILAVLLAPGALIGGYIGAGLTHTLPLKIVRAVFTVLVIAAAGRMGGVW